MGQKMLTVRLKQKCLNQKMKLYATPLKIKKVKLKDLNELLVFIPPIFHDFYKQLNGSEDADSETEAEVSESEDED